MNENSLILELFNLESCDIQKIDYHKIDENSILDVFLVPKPFPCPDCGCDMPKIKGYEVKKIKHSVLTDRCCILNYHARRFKCPICGRTYYEKNPFVFGSMKISALTVQNVLKDLKNYNETFSSVANRYHISPTSVASIFDSHIAMNRFKLPQYICMDECYAFHSLDENSKYVCMMIDFENGNPIDLLPSRRKEYLIKYFRSIPYEERCNVKIISTDMYDVYRQVIHDVFPNALHSVDHYHLSQELSRKVQAIRIRIMKSYANDKTSDEYYLLKNFNWLMMQRLDACDRQKKEVFDPNRKKEYNYHFKAYKNYYDLKCKIQNIHPDLNLAWDLKDEFVDLYDKSNLDTIEDNLNQYIQKLMMSHVKELQDFGKTLKSWKSEIRNSFHIIKQSYKVEKDTGDVAILNHKINNGLIENRNSVLKCIKKNANGYTNWERFRNRCLYVLRKNSTFLLNPTTEKKKPSSL